MHRLLQNLRFAMRQLQKSPGFAVTTILTLALGIGAATAIFSLVNAVLLRPLPFPQQDRLAWLQAGVQAPGGGPVVPNTVSYPDFFDWRARQHSFSGIASHRDTDVTLTGFGDARQLASQIVSSDFFRVLGVSPILGRDFDRSQEKPDTHVAMLSHQVWQSTFGGAHDIAGRTITLDGQSYTVAGVMPASFAFPIQNPPVLLWTLLGDDKQFFEQRGADVLDVIGRLKAGVSLVGATAEMDVIANNLAAQFPESNKLRSAIVAKPLLEHLVGDTRPALRILFAAVALVLLIACANVAGLLLARASRRRSDIALQAALGASPGEIMRQILVESLFLSVVAGACGIALSFAAVQWLPRLVPKTLPRLDQMGVDGMVLAFAVASSVLTGVLFGILPAWKMSRFDPLLALREGSRGMAGARGQHRLQSWLLVSQTALGLVLLVGSGLLMRSFVRILNVDPGFDSKHVLAANLSLPFNHYKREQRIDFYHRLFARVSQLPGVQSVSAGYPLPLSGDAIHISIEVEGRPLPKGEEPSEAVGIVTPNFFETMRIPLLAGRTFTTADDTAAKPVMVINDRFAREYFPGENPVGRHIKPGLGDGKIRSVMREVVGVVGNVKSLGPTSDAEPGYYLPWEQAVVVSPTLVIRSAQDPAALIGPLRAVVSGLDRDVPLFHAATLEESVYHAAAGPRFQTLLLGSFAAMALLLCALGLYALLSYMVVQRSVEIGVRVALGAQRTDVLRLILGRGLALAAAGIAIGLGASALLTRYMTSILFHVEPLDAATFASVTAVLLLVSLISSSVPAFRATRLDPMKTLRDQ